MTKTSKAPPQHVAARANVDELEEQERMVLAAHSAAVASVMSLETLNASGDGNVTAMDLVAARAEVDALSARATHLADLLREARAEHADLFARHEATEARKSLRTASPALAIEECTTAARTALVALAKALADREAESDAVGQRLADARVPQGRWVNGIRYVPVTNYGGRPQPGRFNVEVEADDGSTGWLASTGNHRDSPRALKRAVDSVLKEAAAALDLSRHVMGRSGF